MRTQCSPPPQLSKEHKWQADLLASKAGLSTPNCLRTLLVNFSYTSIIRTPVQHGQLRRCWPSNSRRRLAASITVTFLCLFALFHMFSRIMIDTATVQTMSGCLLLCVTMRQCLLVRCWHWGTISIVLDVQSAAVRWVALITCYNCLCFQLNLVCYCFCWW